MDKIQKRNLISVHISSEYSLIPRYLLFLVRRGMTLAEVKQHMMIKNYNYLSQVKRLDFIQKKDQAKCLWAY